MTNAYEREQYNKRNREFEAERFRQERLNDMSDDDDDAFLEEKYLPTSFHPGQSAVLTKS